MQEPSSGATTGATPVFSGSSSDEVDPVRVLIYEGGVVAGEPLLTLEDPLPSGGSWNSQVPIARRLTTTGTYTAVAEQTESLEGGELGGTGGTPPVSFNVNPEPPTVTLNQPATPSNNTSPTFTGTAGEDTEVVVHVFEGSEQIATATATASGGHWSSGALSTALPEGKHTFTAYAKEKSGLGNSEGQSGTVSFEVNTNVPTVTLNQPATPSSNTSPTFTGTASEETEVVVDIFEGPQLIATAKAIAAGGHWSSGALNKPLPKGKHTFTAFAREKSGLGNSEGQSLSISFEVNTTAPTVTLNQPTTPSKNTSPTFSGEASENGEVVVHVLENSKQVATATVTASAGAWSSGALTKPLPAGRHKFTAEAVEKGVLGNASGKSSSVSFEVNTESPVVTLETPAPRSNVTTPTFAGNANEAGEIVVHVFEGSTEVATSTASVGEGGGHWSSGALNKPLPTGKHAFTVKATESSSLGNPEGKSPPLNFEVNTEPPAVTLNQPTTPSNKRSPTFSGEASESGEIVVHVFEGSTEVATSTASVGEGGGHWSSGALNKPLPTGKDAFTVYATEESGLSNGEGKSATVSFEVNTEPPIVTLEQPAALSNVTTPTFKGTASEAGEVVVHVFKGSEEVASATANVGPGGGSWTSGALNKALPEHKNEFTAYATENSGLGNEAGRSEPSVSFDVNTDPPEVSLNALAKPLSNVTTPTFTGTASEAGEVVVHVFEGTTEVASATASVGAGGGTWSSGALNKALPTGKNKFTAEATEKSGLGNADGKSTAINFEVNTEPPEVTLQAPRLVSNNKTPSFSGTASELGKVTIKVYVGGTPTGPPIQERAASVSTTDDTWSSSALSALADGTYTAIASEPSGLGNPSGASLPVTFEINTHAPTVTLTPPASPSKVTTPSFSGTVVGPESETNPVTVFVHEGSTAGGPVVASVKALVAQGKWKSGTVTLPSGNHLYTAVATTPSAIGNITGESEPRTFQVNTEAPVVTIDQPKTPSNNTKPTFTGTASEEGEVVVEVYRGSAVEGVPAATAKYKGPAGSWETPALSNTLPDGTYTAIARQSSSIGNGQGSSQPVTFRVDTSTPVVTLTALLTPSPNRAPSFSGTTNESEPVIVHVYKGSGAEGAQVAEAEGEGGGSSWVTGRLEEKLELGEYTAVATQKSSIGNPEGKSAPITFVIALIPPTSDTETSSDVTRSSAALYASVNPHAGPVSDCHFEYGPTTAYGKQVECGFVAEFAEFPPAATGAVAVFARIYGLRPLTTYHVRIVAVGEGGTGYGADSTFTTLEPLSFPPAPTTVAKAATSKIGAGGVASLFAAQMVPRGRAARIGALLRNGLFKQRFKAPEAGTAVIDWTYQPPHKTAGAKASRARSAMIVASGKVVFKAAGYATMKIRLTKPGKALLRRSKRVKLKATCRFTPLGGTGITTSVAFQLRR